MPTLNEVNIKLNEIFKKKQLILNELQFLQQRKQYIQQQLQQYEQSKIDNNSNLVIQDQQEEIKQEQSKQKETQPDETVLTIQQLNSSQENIFHTTLPSAESIFLDNSQAKIYTSLTSAQIYAGQSPVTYLMDRDGRASGLLRLSNSALIDLTARSVVNDEFIVFNGARAAHPENVSGLGGVHGPRHGFGSRFQSTGTLSRFKDELIDIGANGLDAQEETDLQFSRINQTQMNTQMRNFQNLRGKQSGIVSLNRLIQEESAMRLRSTGERISLKPGGWRGYGLAPRGNHEEGIKNAIFKNKFHGSNHQQKFKRTSEADLIKQAILAQRKKILAEKSELTFFKDLEYVKANNEKANPYYIKQNQIDFNETPGFIAQEKFNEDFQTLLQKCVSNYGKWSFTMLPSAKKNLDPIDVQNAFINPIQHSMETELNKNKRKDGY